MFIEIVYKNNKLRVERILYQIRVDLKFNQGGLYKQVLEKTAQRHWKEDNMKKETEIRNYTSI